MPYKTENPHCRLQKYHRDVLQNAPTGYIAFRTHHANRENMNLPEPNTQKTERLPLNIETVKQLWSQTYNTDGKPDWSHIFPYYHPNIVFQDSIQRIEGKEEFLAMCNRLTKRTQQLHMEIVSIAQNENVIIFEWIMTMMFKKYPSTPLYGSSKLVLDEEGLIKEQRDYYDLWGDIFNNIPRFGKMYRRFLVKKFG
jgi:limonene-1,2-epoxide hydrolase